MELMEVVDEIAAGSFDDDLSVLREALSARVRYRESIKSAENRTKLVPGTRVRILPGIRPKYIVGLTGVVADQPAKRRGDLMFTFDDESYIYVQHRFQRTVGIPASLLTKVAQ